jgi:hypothetical protein
MSDCGTAQGVKHTSYQLARTVRCDDEDLQVAQHNRIMEASVRLWNETSDLLASFSSQVQTGWFP